MEITTPPEMLTVAHIIKTLAKFYGAQMLVPMSVTAVGDFLLSQSSCVPESSVCWSATSRHGVTTRRLDSTVVWL